MDLETFDIYKQNQIIDGKYIGYHHDLNLLPIKRGDIVVIKKGTVIYSTRYMDKHMAGKTYKVKVSHLLHGAQFIEKGKKIVRNTTVVWAGSGGYWLWVDINEVFKMECEFFKKEEFKI